QLRIQLRRFDLLNIDLNLFALRHLRNFLSHLLDFGAFASDDDAGTRRENSYPNRIPRSFDHDLRNRGEQQLLLHVIANLDVAVQKLRHLLRGCVPARPPVTVHAQSKSNWINFLSHKISLAVPSSRVPQSRDRGIPPRYLKDNFPGILRLRYAPLRMTVHCYFFPFFAARFAGFSAFASTAPSAFASPVFFFAAFCAVLRVSRVSILISSVSTIRMWLLRFKIRL